jgi:1,4-alpha-glucan branching enzyme
MATKRVRPRTVKVEFTLPAEIEADDFAPCGEFNDWSAEDTKLTRGADGQWRATISLEPGRVYRYRYLLDGQWWENSWNAKEYVANLTAETTPL